MPRINLIGYSTATAQSCLMKIKTNTMMGQENIRNGV